ncbi:MAG TPA: TonB-dependent receptor [Candidatus Baltobacteraceae bacterium]|nr:TonB-dependent receptor [Candidatus Baltobacteraceae bacterium]
MHRHTFGRALTAAVMLVAMLSQGTWALAGTTGGLSGMVSDASTGAPIAGARVTVSSPSQTATTTTDGGGHYVFLALAPDTYVVSVAATGDYQISSQAGVTVFADAQAQYSVRLEKLKTISHITSRAMGALVKSGVTSDTYNVNATTATKAAALGGGGNLDNAYSAIASVPGVVVPAGGMGWNQPVYIRGSQSFFSGYEYDGVPVNRAFDNYDSSTESSLGLQELQVYTGGGPASNSSSGTAGFINQVIKTGTYPGFGTFNADISAPQFYHMAKIEAGGSNPDRTFSYYLGLSGYDASPRIFDNSNGASLFTPGASYGYVPSYTVTDNLGGTNGRGLLPLCNADGTTPSSMTSLPWYGADGFAGVPSPFGLAGANSCYYNLQSAATVGNVSDLTDRENVVNLHFAIPRRNGQRDDVQLLWSASALNTIFSSGLNDMGAQGPGGLNPVMLAVTGGPYCPATPTATTSPYCTVGGSYVSLPGLTTPAYVDAPGTYNLPFGTPIVGSDGTTILPTETYYQPSSTQNRAANAALPLGLRDTFHNDTGIVKAQWTHPLSDNAYVRLFGYSFFSDWTQAGAASAWSDYVWGVGGPTAGAEAANYDLITHTAGGEFQFADQLSSQHLLQLTANYTRANTMRFNNYGYVLSYFNGGSPIGLISKDAGGTYHCWNPTTGAEEPCKPGSSWESYGPNPVANPGGTFTAVGNAAAAGAQWETLWNGDASGPRNTVIPKFTFLSLTDQWRPSEKLLFNLGLRYDDYNYGLSNPVAGTDFYSQIIKNDLCVNSAGTVYTSPLKPGQPPPAKPIYTLTCPAGYNHPNFSATSPSTYTISDFSPRFALTYTQSPYTVWRFSAGRFTQPPISASVQYLGAAGDATSVWAATLPLGFTTPFHPIPAMSATQADLSFEHQFRGTDLSMKISPFFNLTQGYQEQSFIGPNFVTQAPVGQFRSEGVELALNKGDFNRDGLSGSLSLTFTNAKVQYQSKYFGANQMATANTAIAQFNSLTSACGANAVPAGTTPGTIVNGCIAGETPASACYTPATGSAFGTPVACTAPGAIANPYFNMPKQSLLDPNGWYAPSDLGLSPTNNPSTTYFDTPLAAALILNYRHDKFAITPSFQVVEGSSYGGPMDITGIDPRACGQNSASAGITGVSAGTNPNQCDYLSSVSPIGATYAQAPSLYIPNPQTGMFAKPGQFRNPNLFLTNLMLSYDVSPKVTATVTLANLYHTCFGGSKEPWTGGIFAPNKNNCGYGPVAPYYVSNFYNGTSPSDAAANGTAPYPWQLQSYVPRAGSDAFAVPAPFNAYVQLQIKL